MGRCQEPAGASTVSRKPRCSLTPPTPGTGVRTDQPNLFPRLTTLAKLFAADTWIILDDVQFTRRDYQHRTRLAALDAP